MRKCFSCNKTKNLKRVFIEDCDCHSDSMKRIFDEINHSVCSQCFFDTCSSGNDCHLAYECLEDFACTSHKQTKKYDTNWNDYNYNWELRKPVIEEKIY